MNVKTLIIWCSSFCLTTISVSGQINPIITVSTYDKNEQLIRLIDMEDKGFCIHTKRFEALSPTADHYIYKFDNDFKLLWKKDITKSIPNIDAGRPIDIIWDELNVYLFLGSGKNTNRMGIPREVHRTYSIKDEINIASIAQESGIVTRHRVALPVEGVCSWIGADKGHLYYLTTQGHKATYVLLEIDTDTYTASEYRRIDLPDAGSRMKYRQITLEDGWFYWFVSDGWIRKKQEGNSVTFGLAGWNWKTDEKTSNTYQLRAKELGIRGWFAEAERMLSTQMQVFGPVISASFVGHKLYFSGYWSDRNTKNATGYWLAEVGLDRGEIKEIEPIAVNKFGYPGPEGKQRDLNPPFVELDFEHDLLLFHHTDDLDKKFSKKIGLEKGDYYCSVYEGGKEIGKAPWNLFQKWGANNLSYSLMGYHSEPGWLKQDYFQYFADYKELPPEFEFFGSVTRNFKKSDEFKIYNSRHYKMVVLADGSKNELIIYSFPTK